MTNTFDGPFLAIPKWAIPTVVQNPSALQVLCGLVDHMDIRTKVANVPIGELSEAVGLSRKTVQRSLRWLESEGVVDTQQSPNGASSYTLRYTQRGVTGDRGVGHGCPGGRSRVTGGEVTGDLPNGIKNSHLPGFCRNVIENTIESVKEELKKGAAGPEGATMILGGDHEEEDRKEHRQQTIDKNRSHMKSLTHKFLYHPSHFHRSKASETEVLMLKRTLKRMLDGGMTPATISSLIDLFMSSPFGQYDHPVRAFSSKKVQEVLVKKLRITVTHEDPVLQFLAQDCQRGDLDLPWPEDQDQDLVNALILRSIESTFRYPDLVSQIITYWAGDFRNPGFIAALTALESIIKHGLGKEFVDVYETAESIPMVDLPKDLLKGTVRNSPATMSVAVYESRRSPNV